jgi:hypothetical protein
MKKLLFLIALWPSLAYASDEPMDCAKKEGVVKCVVKKDDVLVDEVVVNGGDCAPDAQEIVHHAFKKGDKFSVKVKSDGNPLSYLGCGYVRIVKFKTHDGKEKTFSAL